MTEVPKHDPLSEVSYEDRQASMQPFARPLSENEHLESQGLLESLLIIDKENPDVTLTQLVTIFDVQVNEFYESLERIACKPDGSGEDIERSYALLVGIRGSIHTIAEYYTAEIADEVLENANKEFERVLAGIYGQTDDDQSESVTEEAKAALTTIVADEYDRRFAYAKYALPAAKVREENSYDMHFPYVESLIDESLQQRRLHEAAYALGRLSYNSIATSINSINAMGGISIRYDQAG